MNKVISLLIMPALMCAFSCNGAQSAKSSEAAAPAAAARTLFCGDSAYAYVAQQVAFGPRVPGTLAAETCGDWLADKLAQSGASDIRQQRTTLTAYNGDQLPIRNISASFFPEKQERMLLLAHWDSRPWADAEPDAALRNKPIDGANDGASGVGVILEIARVLPQLQPAWGVDILLVDAEDYGRRQDDADADDADNSWALGSQYWVKNPTLDLSKINHAILLDMVGGKDAVFPREYVSERYARPVNDQVWNAARKAGHATRFPNRMGGAVVDDHVYLLQAGIPAIDIIESQHPATDTFPPYWHTSADNMSQISAETLQAVGATVLQHITQR